MTALDQKDCFLCRKTYFAKSWIKFGHLPFTKCFHIQAFIVRVKIIAMSRVKHLRFQSSTQQGMCNLCMVRVKSTKKTFTFWSSLRTQGMKLFYEYPPSWRFIHCVKLYRLNILGGNGRWWRLDLKLYCTRLPPPRNVKSRTYWNSNAYILYMYTTIYLYIATHTKD